MKVGDSGIAEFTYKKKNFKGYFKGMGSIIDTDNNWLIFRDNDGFEYLVHKTKFRFVEK